MLVGSALRDITKLQDFLAKCDAALWNKMAYHHEIVHLTDAVKAVLYLHVNRKPADFTQVLVDYGTVRLEAMALYTELMSMTSSDSSPYTPNNIAPNAEVSTYCTTLCANESTNYILLLSGRTFAEHLPIHTGTDTVEFDDFIRERASLIPTIKTCAAYYIKALKQAQASLDTVALQSKTFVEESPTFDFDGYQMVFGDELVKVNEFFILLGESLSDYSQNKTSKLLLVDQLGTGAMNALEANMENIITAIEIQELYPYRSYITKYQNIISRVYSESITIFNAFNVYFNNSFIEEILRSMKIWLNPQVDMDTAELLRFVWNVNA